MGFLQRIRGSTLETVHKRAAKTIHKFPKSTCADNFLNNANWKNVSYIYKRHVACLTHKIYYNKCPDTLKDLVMKSESLRTTRNCCKVDLTRPKNKRWQKFIQAQGSIDVE